MITNNMFVKVGLGAKGTQLHGTSGSLHTVHAQGRAHAGQGVDKKPLTCAQALQTQRHIVGDLVLCMNHDSACRNAESSP